MMRIAVCGAGAMGTGIAQVAAQAGHTVQVFDVQPLALAAGKARIEAAVNALVKKRKLDEVEGRAIGERLAWTSDLAALADVDLVIEAIIEDAAIKGELFSRIEDVVRDDAIIASNTSSIPISRLARGLARPERFVGMHFFNPAPVMKLVEIVAGVATDAEVAERVAAVAKAWGKVAIPVADVPGFIVNRVARPFYAEAFTALTEDAADATQIDSLFRSAGFRMGPLELTDLIGQDVNFAVARSVYDSYFGQTRFVPQLRQAALVDAGWFGRKSGRGVFRYDDAAAVKVETPPVPQPVDEDRAAAETIMQQLFRGSTLFTRRDGVMIGVSRGRTASREARESGQPVALLDWFETEGAGPIGFAASDDAAAAAAEAVIAGLGRLSIRIADRPGLIVTRTLAQLANGGADAVLEQVADEAGIDAALRFGANYPFGPFAWMERFGRQRLVILLDGIAETTGTGMYRPSQYLRDSAR